MRLGWGGPGSRVDPWMIWPGISTHFQQLQWLRIRVPSFWKYSTMSISLFPSVSLTFPKVVSSQKSCFFLKFIVQGKRINRCTVRVEMLSLSNGMHRADIMSEIVSGRKPLLSAPFNPLLEKKYQMDNCPLSSDSTGSLTDLFALYCTSLLLQVEMLSFFSSEISGKRHCV